MTEPELKPIGLPEPSPFAAHVIQHEIEDTLAQLKALILVAADHQLAKINVILHEAGIDSRNAKGVRELASFANTRRDSIVDEMKEKLKQERAIEGRAATPFYAGMEFMTQFIEYGEPK